MVRPSALWVSGQTICFVGEWLDHLLCGQTICSVVRPSALWSDHLLCGWEIIHQLGAETGKCVVVVFGMAFSITIRWGVTSRARASHSALMEGITTGQPCAAIM